MRKKVLVMMSLCMTLFVSKASAQWTVVDPTNLAQGIVNSCREIVQTSTTAENMINNFKETVKIYEQGKKYYDALKSVNNLVRDARKVQQTIVMVGDITDIYVGSFQKMMHDENFSVEELSAIASGYTKLLEESTGVLNELKTVVNISTLSMTDKDRMDVVDKCYRDMKHYRNLVNYYTNKNISVSYLRAKKKHDLDRVLDMMPLCSQMTGVARAVAGFGALFYIAYRVWQSLARAEPIDVFPMLRPFAIGICILLFPTLVLGTLNSVMSPIVQGVSTMLEGQKLDLEELRQQKDELETEMMKRNPETAYLVDDAEFDKELENLGISPSDLATMAGMYAERGLYKLQKMIRDGFRYILELVFEAVSLMIDVLRTFFLIVLSILGPLAFGIAAYDGFQSTLTGWMCRYIQVYLWLPIADLFSCILARIQQLSIEHDIVQMQTDPGFSLDSSDGVYLIMMLIGIIGYFTVPTVAGWVIQAGGIGNYNRNVNKSLTKSGGAMKSGALWLAK